jgi:hypothetical protein
MVVGTEFLAIDGTVYEQGRLQKTVGLYEDSNYRVRVTLGSGQFEQKVTGNGISALLEAQKAVQQTIGRTLGLIYNHGLKLASNSGTYYNNTGSAEIETISGDGIFNDPEGSIQVYDYNLTSAGTASSDAYSFYFNMEYKPFGFATGESWIIRNGRNDTVQDGTDASKGAIPLSVVVGANNYSPLQPGVYEGNNPAPLDLTAFGAPAFDGSSSTAYEAALDFFNTPAVAEAAQYGSYTVVVGSAAQTMPQTLSTHISLGSSSGTASYPAIKNIMLNFRSTGAQTWYKLAYQLTQGTNRVSYGEGITEFDITLIDLSVSDPRSLLQSPYYSYTAESAGGFYTINDTGTENITVINSTTDKRIEIGTDTTPAVATITLDDAEIDLSAASAVSPIKVTSGSALTLNLANGSNNKVVGAINYAGIQTTYAELIIGPQGSTGTLTARSTSGANGNEKYGAGIGGSYISSGNNYDRGIGTITINGGTVAASGEKGAAIGAAYSGYDGTITIAGDAKVKAVTTDTGAAIGSGSTGRLGYRDNGDNIAITIGGSAVVYAQNTSNGNKPAAIGDGYSGGRKHTIEIRGTPTVVAIATYTSAIGEGYYASNGCIVNISGGTVITNTKIGGSTPYTRVNISGGVQFAEDIVTKNESVSAGTNTGTEIDVTNGVQVLNTGSFTPAATVVATTFPAGEITITSALDLTGYTVNIPSDWWPLQGTAVTNGPVSPLPAITWPAP